MFVCRVLGFGLTGFGEQFAAITRHCQTTKAASIEFRLVAIEPGLKMRTVPALSATLWGHLNVQMECIRTSLSRPLGLVPYF